MTNGLRQSEQTGDIGGTWTRGTVNVTWAAARVLRARPARLRLSSSRTRCVVAYAERLHDERSVCTRPPSSYAAAVLFT